jgi:hypothetical protein
MKLYAFIDIEKSILAAWETAIGRLCSAVTSREGIGVSLFMFNRLRGLSNGRQNRTIQNEFILEMVRQQYFSLQTSRLKGLYFFETIRDATRAHEEWEFSCPPEYLCEINFDCVNFSKVDSQWITNFLSKKTDNSWMHKYWNGEALNDKPLYEIIAEGRGVIKNSKIKRVAYDFFLEKQPDTGPLLYISCCAFRCGYDDISRVVPNIYLTGNNLNGRYLIDMNMMNKLEKEISNAIKDRRKFKDLKKPKLPKDENIFFRVPNMPTFEFEVELNSTELADIAPHFSAA